MTRKVYIAVSKDKFELPYAVADTKAELARLCGVSKNSIASAISKTKHEGKKFSYKEVEIDDED